MRDEARDPVDALAEALAAHRAVVMVTLIAAPGGDRAPVRAGGGAAVGARALFDASGGAALLAGRLPDLPHAPELEPLARAWARAAAESGRPATHAIATDLGEVRVFVEPYLPPPRLVVVGAGHVAQPLADIGKRVGFRVTVLDDRPAYASRERFPTADEIVCRPFLEALDLVDPGPESCVVIVTRGHQHDFECLRHVLSRPLRYLGMIGSRTRVTGIVDRLLAEGADPARVSRVHAPIGLDIGAETPAEIAISILAEIVLRLRGGTGAPLSRDRRDGLIHRGRYSQAANG